jgi:hypothetical protein
MRDARTKEADRYIRANYHPRAKCTIDAILYTFPDQSMQYWVTRGIKKKEKWVARHKVITQKEALASARNARRLEAYDKGRLLSAYTAELIAKATHQTKLDCTHKSGSIALDITSTKKSRCKYSSSTPNDDGPSRRLG